MYTVDNQRKGTHMSAGSQNYLKQSLKRERAAHLKLFISF